MYLIPITVPIYKDGTDLKVATDWKRALTLLRDSLEGRYGPLVVAAPWADAASSEQPLEGASLFNDDIQLLPAFHHETRLRNYWFGPHQKAMQSIYQLLPRVQVVHGCVEDALRSFCYSAFMQVANAHIPSVFVQDQDVVTTIRDFHRNHSLAQRQKAELHARLHERQCRKAISVAGN